MTGKKTKRKPFRSLSFTLIAAFLGVSLSALLIVGSLELYFAFRAQKQSIADNQELVARGAANEVSSSIQEKVRSLKQAASINSPTTVNPQRQELVMNKLLGLNPEFRELSILNLEGQQLQKVSRFSITTSSPLPDSTKEALLAKVSEGEIYISPVFINRATGEPLVTMAVPANDIFNAPAGVLTAEVNLKFMWDLIGRIKVGASGLAYVVDKQGRLIAHADISQVLAAKNLSGLREVGEFIHNKGNHEESGIGISKGIKEGYVLSSYVGLGTPDWAVVIELPVTEAYGPAIRSASASLLVVFVSSGVVIAVARHLSRRITRPLLALRDAAERISQGNLDVKIKIASRNELGQLATTFNAMADDLQQNVRALRYEHTRLETSINSLDAGFILTDRAQNILTINRVAQELLCLSPDHDHPSINPRCSMEDVQASLKNSFDMSGHIAQCLANNIRVDVGNITYGDRFLRVYIAPIAMPADDQLEVIGAVVLVEDTTEAKIIERSKDEFFSIASHELRTPLTAIKGNTAMIMQYFGDSLKDENLKEMISDIHASSGRLIEIVNDFLDLSRLEQGKTVFKKEEFSMEEIIESVVYEMKQVTLDKNIYLKFDKMALDSLPKVRADKNRTKQIVYNLVGNAAKFIDRGGIDITADTDNDMVRVLVNDSGRGIPAEAQKLLFHKFQQASNSLLTRDATRGTGLGLYISKMMAENMGGSVKLEKSQEGIGTSFSFSLPVATERLRQQAAKEAAAGVDTASGLTVTPPGQDGQRA